MFKKIITILSGNYHDVGSEFPSESVDASATVISGEALINGNATTRMDWKSPRSVIVSAISDCTIELTDSPEQIDFGPLPNIP